MTDKQLYAMVKKAIMGDKNAFATLCESTGRNVLYLCRLNTHSREDAEDAAQEVFFQMQQSIRQLNKPESFGAWLSRLVTYTCNSLRRKNMNDSNHIPIEDVEDGLPSETLDSLPQQYLEDAVLREQVVEAVKALPDKYRQCVLMHYFQQLSYREIAEALEISEDRVDYSLRMARKHMKIEIDELRKKDSEVWAAAPMVGIGPALQAIFSESAKATIPSRSVTSCMRAAGIYHTPAAAGAAAGTGIAVKTVLQAAAIAVAATASVFAAAFTIDKIVNPTPPATPLSTAGEAPGFPQNQAPPPPAGGWSDEDKPVLMTRLSGRVFFDNNGVIDPLVRTGLPGVQVELIRAVDDKAVATAQTQDGAENGFFAFQDFEEGEYRLRVTLPPGVEPLDHAACEPGPGQAVWLKHKGETIFRFDGGTSKEIEDVTLSLCNKGSVSGRVSIRAGTEELAGPLPAITVRLLDPQGYAVCETKVGEGGQYRFHNPLISQNGQYTLCFQVGNVAGLQVPYDTVPLQIQPGQTVTAPARILTDTSPPQIILHLESGDCRCGHLNPTNIRIEVLDATPAACHWALTQSGDGTGLAAGTEETALQAALTGLPSGEYRLEITAQDTAGNRSALEQVISIT